MFRTAVILAWASCHVLAGPSLADSLYSHGFDDLQNIQSGSGLRCDVGPAPGGKAGQALHLSNPQSIPEATAVITPPTPLPDTVTVVFRIYIDRYTGAFQAIYNHPPGEGLRFMPGGRLEGSCGEPLPGEWVEKTWYTVAIVLADTAGLKIYLRPGAGAQLNEEDLLGETCGHGRPMTRTTLFNHGGDIYLADYTINEGEDLTIMGEPGSPPPPPKPIGLYTVPFTVTSDLPFAGVPMDPSIAFGHLIGAASIQGFLDHNSIRVRNATTGEYEPRAIERFGPSDTLKVEWVIEDPAHKQYEIEFATTAERKQILPAPRTPMIGVGDLLRYNAGEPRPIMAGYPSGLYDLTGDGKPDLVGVWNYGRRGGDRWDGVVVFPRVGALDQAEFADLFRIYEVPDVRYSRADVGDFDQDGLPDIAFAPRQNAQITLYHNTGRRHATLMPAYQAAGTIERPAGSGWAIRVIDLDRDGKLDIVCGTGFPNWETGAVENTAFLQNTTTGHAWPPTFTNAGNLSIAGGLPAFFDVDGDGAPDAVVLLPDRSDPGLSGFRVGWQKNLGGATPQFSEPQLLAEVNQVVWRPMDLAAVDDGPQPTLLVQHHNWERVTLFVRGHGSTRLKPLGVASSVSAELALSDQAWPYPCDWDGDGDWDLLVGGGYGWPRILINDGTSDRPAFREAQFIEAAGEPIRLVRNEILGEPFHGHNMGYPYPIYADWDADGLPDLIIPNETNRIFWYRNVGTRRAPRFGRRQLLGPEDYLESPEKQRRSAELALKATYPKEEDQPFFWRTGAAVGDFNGDRLLDLATHDGATRKLTLFTQYRDDHGRVRLKKDRPLTLDDGRFIDESIVGRSSGWTESFDAIDWNGDGLTDLVYSLSGKSGDTVYLLRNTGTRESASFASPEPVRLFGEPINITAHGPHVGVADLDGDGRPEVIGCTEWSVYAFYRGTALAMGKRPTWTLGVPRAAADPDR